MPQRAYQNFTAKTVKQALKELKTSEKGLSEKEAKLRLRQNGKNELVGKQYLGWQIFLRQWQSPFIYLLLFAGGISVFLRQYLDAALIFTFLLVTGFLSFFQEYRSEKILEKLKSYITTKAKVKRDNQLILVKKSHLVLGDLVLLEAGDLVPADLRIIEAQKLLVDESILTGESQTVNKTEKIVPAVLPEHYQAKNILFAATKIINGKACGLVFATGAESEIGKIAILSKQIKKESAFQKNLLSLSRFLIKVVGITLMMVFLANLLLKAGQIDPWQLVLFTVALTVSILPDALTVVAAISLSKAAFRLAKKNVVIKRLANLEDLGNIDVLCVDKTGTLTENLLTVERIFAHHQNEFLFAALAGLPNFRHHRHQSQHNFNEALCQAADKKIKKRLTQTVLISEIPFDPERRLGSVLIKEKKQAQIIVRGAPEDILKLCRYYFPEDSAKPKTISLAGREQLKRQFQAAGVSGHRIFGVGIKKAAARQKSLNHKSERGLTFLGFASFVDPLKASAGQTLEAAKNLGVEVKILTGDTPEVAAAVAQRVGLIKSENEVVTGSALLKLKSAQIEHIVLTHKVFARVNPEQKYHIVQILQKHSSVGFLGEGINDVPALKLANVGIVVNSGTDVAKEAGDIVLLRKDLRVIIEAIAEGRKTFANIMKYLKTILIGNFGNFYSLAAISLILAFLPLLPTQILLVNFLTDLPLIAVVLDAVDKDELARPRHYNLKSLAFFAIFLGLLSSIFDFIFFAYFRHLAPGDLRTLWFIESVFSELILIVSIRTNLPFFKASPPNKFMAGLWLIAGFTALGLPFSPWASVFHFQKPLWSHLSIIILILLGYLLTNEIVKVWYYRWKNSRKNLLTQG